MSELFEKQVFFAQCVAQLIQQALQEGYQITLGEVWRSEETAKLNALEGKGIKNSLHRLRLAIDVNLFKDGSYLSATKDYERLGNSWEGLSTGAYQACWGGRFGDGNHFSISHNGIK